jgi:hypothetical protein
MKMSGDFLDNSVPHVLYDVNLPMDERRAKALYFKTSSEVALFLGCEYRKIAAYRKPGRRITGRDGKTYAIRIAKTTDVSK